MPIAISIAGTAAALVYRTIDVVRQMGPEEFASHRVIHLALLEMFAIGGGEPRLVYAAVAVFVLLFVLCCRLSIGEE